MRTKTLPGSNPRPSEALDRLYLPTPREAAMILLHLVQAKERATKRQYSRVRLSSLTLRKLWRRHEITSENLARVQEFLGAAGWVLFWSGSNYGLIKIDSVEGWPRLSSKRIKDDLDQIARGRFDFDELEPLLPAAPEGQDQADDSDSDG